MPVRTPHFGLEAFITGDIYSASVDQRRFTIIDAHMAFISDLVGPGKIKGWDLSVPSPFTLSVSSGWGMIGRNITRTFGDYKKSLLDNSSVYAWMRIRPGVIGQISPFSKIASVNYVDSDPPSTPNGLFIKNKSIDSVTISWPNDTSIDFSYYEIFKSENNLSYSLLSEIASNEYTDTGLDENSVYYYKIKSYDLSGNASGFSDVLFVTTDKDLSKPSDPVSVNVVSSISSLHVTWNLAPYGNISKYRAYVTPVTEERLTNGDTVIFEVSGSNVDMTLRNLTNEQRYIVVLKSVSKWGIESDGVSRIGIPVDNGGPPDVSEIIAIDYKTSSGVSSNGINLTWNSDLDTYELFNGTSEIILEEYRSDGTVIVSEPIPTLIGYSTRSLEIFSYKIDQQVFYKSIEPRTVYFVTIKNVDINGIKSAGKRIRHYTKTFINPETVQSLSVLNKPDKSFVLRWGNSPSIFSSNLVSVSIINLENSTRENVFVDNNVGRSTIFSLDSSYSRSNSRYIFSVKCVDEFDNESEPIEVTYEIGEVASLPKPPPPLQQIGFAGDGQNILTWNAAITDSVKSYRIYRANDRAALYPEDFVLLETVSSNIFTYTDYEVENGRSYVYFITTVDIFNQESLNPINDRYLNYSMITLKPASSSTLSSPGDLQKTVIGNNVQLYWQPTGGQFDGYEIFRSVGNKHSFELIGTVSPSVTYYVDSNVLNKSGYVYYIVRKFRNEADLFVTESDIIVTNAVYLGKVTTKNGISKIDTSGIRNILKLEDPVRIESQARIALHKHEYIDDSNDRRINLSDKLLVSDWITDDNQTYKTNTDISETTTYSVYLNGEEVSNFGLLFSLNKDDGVLTFETPLASSGFEIDQSLVFLFESPPSLVVEFDNLEEVQNILPKARVNSLSSQQVGTGVFEKSQIPSISHNGRIKEKLIPVQISTVTVDDGYRYAPSSADEPIGDAVVFYDIIQTVGDSDVLVASTSDGVYTSDNFGISWNKKFETITPIIKFFYSRRFDTYFAGTNRGILFGRGGDSGGFSIWTEIPGTENTKIVRDIVEDQDGNVFCSSDLGVYKLRRDIGQGSFFFQQTPIFGPKSTEAYSMLFDELRNRLIFSNELGIFESYNSGVLWEFSDEFREQRPIHSFAQKSGYIFAITDFMLWRRKPNENYFERIGVMESSSISRKMVIWNDRVYISTDTGLLVTTAKSDIFSDSTVIFEPAFSGLQVNDKFLPSLSLSVIDNKLFVGSEDKLFISNKPGKLFLHCEFESEVIPSVYVNGELQSIGYRFTTSSDRFKKFVCFDVKQKLGAVVTVANQYKKFRAKHGGWADTNFVSSVSLFIDGLKMNTVSLAEKPAQLMSQLILPSYNDRNAHKKGADDAKIKFEEVRNSLLAVDRNNEGQITRLKGFTKDNVVATLYSIERFISQLYETARIIQITDDQGQISETPFVIPDFRVLLLSPTSNDTAVKISSFGLYNIWTDDSDNSQSSVIGYFGSELTSDGTLPQDLLGGG